MLLNGIHKIIKEEFQVVFISESETIWRNLERDAGSYIPIDYSFYNLIYQKNISRLSMMITQIFH